MTRIERLRSRPYRVAAAELVRAAEMLTGSRNDAVKAAGQILLARAILIARHKTPLYTMTDSVMKCLADAQPENGAGS